RSIHQDDRPSLRLIWSHILVGGVLNVEIRHSMPPINTCFIECKAFGGNHHLHFKNTTSARYLDSLVCPLAGASPREAPLRRARCSSSLGWEENVSPCEAGRRDVRGCTRHQAEGGSARA